MVGALVNVLLRCCDRGVSVLKCGVEKVRFGCVSNPDCSHHFINKEVGRVDSIVFRRRFARSSKVAAVTAAVAGAVHQIKIIFNFACDGCVRVWAGIAAGIDVADVADGGATE